MSAPKKILLITYEYPPLGGGTGKAARNTAIHLARMGYEASILTSAFEDLPREEMDLGVRVVRIPVKRRYLNYANAVEVLSFAGSGVLRAAKLAETFRPDLCLAYHTIPSGIVAWRIARRMGVPYFALLRGQDVPGYPEMKPWMHALAWPVTSFLWKRALRVVANSEGLADLAHRSAPDLRIDVVRNGIDLDLYCPPAGGRARRAGMRVLYTGRLVRKKRIRELVEAFAILRRNHPDSELLIAGFGPEREPLEALAAERGVADRVRFLGRLDEAAIVEALQSADIFVNPSEGEGLPNAVLEAMACALPVVLSDIGPHRELIGDGEAGLLCNGDAPSIAEALGRLAASPEMRERMGAAARQIVEREFGWSEMTKRLVELFPGWTAQISPQVVKSAE